MKKFLLCVLVIFSSLLTTSVFADNCGRVISINDYQADTDVEIVKLLNIHDIKTFDSLRKENANRQLAGLPLNKISRLAFRITKYELADGSTLDRSIGSILFQNRGNMGWSYSCGIISDPSQPISPESELIIERSEPKA